MQTLIFNSNQVRVEQKNGETWFCGADVARAIGYKNAAQAIADNVSPKYICRICLGGRGRKPLFVSEPGIYQLIVKSSLPSATVFQNWLYEQVLPAIRQTGQYIGQMPLAELGVLFENLPALVARENANRTSHPFKVRDKAIINYGNGNFQQCTILDFLGGYVCIRLADGTTDIVGASKVSLAGIEK